jgi:hypothetical protein
MTYTYDYINRMLQKLFIIACKILNNFIFIFIRLIITPF